MRTFAVTLICASVLAVSMLTPVFGAESYAGDRAQQKAGPELIPGAYLMTPAEREQYRQRMQAAQGAQERDRIRVEHTDAMEKRARAVGLSLARGPVSKSGAGDPARGSRLHNVCFSCHGSERYSAAKERAATFLSSSVALASGIEETANASDRRPDTLPPGAPRMSRSQVKNLAGLKRAIVRWNDFFNPTLSETEVDDLVAYLNAAYYKF